MSSFFSELEDPDAIPLPPAEVRIKSVNVTPFEDKQRLHVNVELTPFQQRPWVEVILRNAKNEEIASINIVETMTWKIEFTMHIRGEQTRGAFSALARVYYPEQEDNDKKDFGFTIED